MGDVTFSLRINGGEKQSLTVKTGIYLQAAAAAVAIFGVDLPAHIELWCDDLLSRHPPMMFRVNYDYCGRLLVSQNVGPYQKAMYRLDDEEVDA